jgi:Ca2+-binding EF-hand superfamily protein
MWAREGLGTLGDSEIHLREAFNVYDQDRDGYIDAADLKRGMWDEGKIQVVPG